MWRIFVSRFIRCGMTSIEHQPATKYTTVVAVFLIYWLSEEISSDIDILFFKLKKKSLHSILPRNSLVWNLIFRILLIASLKASHTIHFKSDLNEIDKKNVQLSRVYTYQIHIDPKILSYKFDNEQKRPLLLARSLVFIYTAFNDFNKKQVVIESGDDTLY